MKAKAMILDGDAPIDWNHFEQSLHDHFGVNAVTLRNDGARRTSGDMLWANDLCALIKNNPNGAKKICNSLLWLLIHEAKAKKTAATGECYAGINKIVLPIIQNEEINGFVNICGRPFSNADRTYPEYIQKTIDAGVGQIENLLPSLQPIGPRTIKAMIHFITSYAH
jgi:ligand-binding sensor protein